MVDIDGDKDIDIYVVNQRGQQNRLWINDGTGSFTSKDISGDTSDSAGVSIGDVNGDGNLDIYVSTQDDGLNKLWINDGYGNFVGKNIPGNYSNSSGSAMADIDNDGDLDIFVTNRGGQNILWLNDGSGVFTKKIIPGDNYNAWGVSIGDIDSDGDLDIYLAVNPGQNILLINDGNDGFTEKNIIGDVDNSISSSMSDIDGDGDLDIYVVNYGQQNRLWINDGSGNFTSSDISGDKGNTHGGKILDIDGDGKLELYAANSNGQQNRLWVNGYSDAKPYVESNSMTTFVKLSGFKETLSQNSEGTVSYQVSIDNGTTWQYWNGTAWAVTTQLDGTETTKAVDIDTNIHFLDDGLIGKGQFKWRAYLESDGNQIVELDRVELGYDSNLPPTDIILDGVATATPTDKATDTVDENRLIGSVISYLSTVDGDNPNPPINSSPNGLTTDIHTYSIIAGADLGMFEIEGNKLILNTNQPDFENPNDDDADRVYEIVIRTTDLRGKTFDKNVEISLVDIVKEDTVVDNYKVNRLDAVGEYIVSDSNILKVDDTGVARLKNQFISRDIAGDLGKRASVGDVNNDGYIDIYVVNDGNNQNKLWINDGAGNFVAKDIAGDLGESIGSSIGDLNNDGYLDIYVANNRGQNKLWINDGAGNFIAKDITGDFGDSRKAVIGDLNNDGYFLVSKSKCN